VGCVLAEAEISTGCLWHAECQFFTVGHIEVLCLLHGIYRALIFSFKPIFSPCRAYARGVPCKNRFLGRRGAMARKKQSKLGRPPKHEGERLSKNRTFRVRGTLDEQLEAAAQKAGRSVSEEIERRLDDSFKRIEELYGGPHLSATFRILADNLALVKAKFGERWAENDFARDEIARAFAAVIVREVPGFYSVTIETGEPGGTISGFTRYRTKEIAERENPGMAETLRRHRAAQALPQKEAQALPQEKEAGK